MKTNDENLELSDDPRKIAEKDSENLGKHNNYFDNIIQELSLYQQELELQNYELYRISDELQKEKSRYTDLFENSPIGHVIFTEDYIIKSANSAFIKLMGHTKEEVLQNSILELIHPQSRETFITYINSILITKISDTINIKVQDENNAGVYKVQSYVEKENSGCLLVVAAFMETDPKTVSDFINRRYIEDEIIINTERLMSQVRILEHRSDDVQELLDFALNETLKLISSKIGYIYFYNEASREFILNSWSKNVLKQCKIPEPKSIYKLDDTGLWGEVVRQRKEIIINNFEAENSLKKGLPVGHVQLKRFLTIPVFDRKKIVAVVGVGNKETDYNETDVKQLKLIMGSVWRFVHRTEIINENQRLSKALEQSPAHIMITDYEGKIEYVNNKFFEVTGFSTKDVYGKNPRILKSGSTPQQLYKYLWETIKSGREWRGELLNKKKDGTLYWEYNSISCVRNEKDEITHFIAVKEDVTVRKAIENELIKAKEQAEESSRLKTSFLNNISHEVRTPMNAIVGFADLLNGHNLSKGKQEMYIETINSSARQLLGIIDDVLDLSRLESGSVKLKTNDFSLTELFSDICFTLEKEALSHNLYLIFENPGISLYDSISADREKIKQILTGLIMNAFKFTPTGGIKTGFFFTEEKLTFYVKDTGIGILKSEHNKIFDRFYKIEQNNYSGSKGTGLGLSIAKGLIEIMGGEIWVESELGKGTTFYFTSLWKPAEKKYQMQEDIELEKCFNVDILIVDDEINNFDYLNELLKSKVSRTFWAKNGIEAINITEKYKPAIILMDLKMPGMNGFEATKLIKEKHPEILIIAQSAYSQEEDKEKALKAGCNDYLTKPVSKSNLFNCIKKLMEK